MSVIMKKGGNARLEIKNFSNLDYLTIPAGYKLETVSVKKSGTTAGNIKLGDYVDALPQITSIEVTAAPTEAGNISVVLAGGTAVLVPVLGTESIAETVTKLASATYLGWTVEESLGTTVTWTATVAGVKTGVYTITGPTGFTKLGPQEEQAGANPTAGEQTVASVALSETDGNVSNLTVVKKLYSADTKVYIAVSSSATGTLVADIQKIF